MLASSQPLDTMSARYNDSHRLFMQTMLSHRKLHEEKAVDFYERICELTELTPQDFDDFVDVVNNEINDVDLTLRRSRDERDGRTVIVLVNTKDDEIAQVATNYTTNEIAYFKQLLEMIVLSDDENFAVSSLGALRLGTKMKPPISQRETQDLLDRFVEDQWLYTARRDAYYVMDPRTILELMTYLREQYSDVLRDCKMCMEIITMGERCELQNCDVRMHRHCADTFFSNREASCPSCKTAWSRTNTFGLGLPL